tara:strand:+ start:271 stop:795 length:525 start_codon:yes stop_codon:yes gene_type:complete
MILIKDTAIFLRKLKYSDTNGEWPTWLNDKSTVKYTNKRNIKNSTETVIKYFKKKKNSKNDILFAICKKNNEHIGNIGLHKIKNQSAQYGILLGKKYQSKGYGTRALKLLIKYAFTKLFFKKIYTYIDNRNFKSIKITKKNYFKKTSNYKFKSLKNGTRIKYDKYLILNKYEKN